MQVNIHIFDCLMDVAKAHKVTQSEWAKRAGMGQPRIAELVKLSKLRSVGKEESIGRLCSLDKIRALADALSTMIGRDGVTKALLKQIEKEDNIINQLVIMSIALENEPIEKQLQAREYLKLLLPHKTE